MNASGIIALENPVMIRVVLKAPFAHRPRHHVQIIHLVTIGRAAGVMALWHEHDIAVRYRHGLVQRTVFGEDALETETLRRVEAVVIGLLEIGHVGVVILVMTVRRIGRPVARGREDLRDQQAVGHIALFHGDGEDVARIGALAALRQLHTVRPDLLRLAAALFAGCGADADGAISRGGQRPFGAGRNINAMWRLALEHIHAVAEFTEILTACGNRRLAFDQHEDDFRVASFLRCRLARLQSVKAETDITPIRALGRDIVHLAAGRDRLAQK
ncbi:Hypothetical protein AT6N2_L1645 [Agrobacterium tumefaciens]|nr:Hypothetical protein AT6N2_L1645 [Agrobacterium tumefaciens]